MPGWLEMLSEVGAGRLSSVRVIPTGGDWVRPEVVRGFRAEAPALRFAGLGGATENRHPQHNFRDRRRRRTPIGVDGAAIRHAAFQQCLPGGQR